jgi:hypothetical protein
MGKGKRNYSRTLFPVKLFQVLRHFRYCLEDFPVIANQFVLIFTLHFEGRYLIKKGIL